MGARKPVKPNARYTAQELRRTTIGHPDPDDCLAKNGSPPRETNPVQPATTPGVERKGTYGISDAVPIDLSEDRGRWYPPPLGVQLRCATALRKRRLHEEIKMLANGEHRGQEWLEAHASQIKVAQPWPKNFNGLAFLKSCNASLFRRIPKLGRRRDNLSNKMVQHYIMDQMSIIFLLEQNVGYFRGVYAQLASIANNNFRKGSDGGKKVTLGRLIKAYECLPSIFSDKDLVDVAFYGMIDSSLIHMDHYVMSDLLGLAAALGHLAYGTFRPTREQAQAYLYAVSCAPDASRFKDRLAPERRQLATLIVQRFGLPDLQPELIDICCAVVCGRRIPEALHELELDILP